MSEKPVPHPEILHDTDQLELLIFKVGPRNFSVRIQDVTEIIRYREPTSVPNTANYVDGIISYRGKMVPVLNARKRLGYPAGQPDLRTSILIVRDGTENYGIVVDFASLVIQMNGEEMSPPSSVDAESGMIGGIFSHKNQDIYLLNLPVFLQF
jgi:purine-binding chemotaxis protein CheW